MRSSSTPACPTRSPLTARAAPSCFHRSPTPLRSDDRLPLLACLLLALAVELDPLRVAVPPDLRLDGGLGLRAADPAQRGRRLGRAAVDGIDDLLGHPVL